MSLNIFSFTPAFWRNGTSWIGRFACKGISEQTYNSIRVYKRISYAEFYYMKQNWLYWLYMNKPDVANFLAVMPKPDSTHGFPYKETPGRYAQNADDTTNSDGYAGWYTYIGCFVVYVWNCFIYFIPRRWINGFDMVGEDDRYSERFDYYDGYMQANFDTSLFFWKNYFEKNYTPHRFASQRRNHSVYFGPDSKTRAAALTFNRKNLAYDHHWRGVGMERSMT